MGLDVHALQERMVRMIIILHVACMIAKKQAAREANSGQVGISRF